MSEIITLPLASDTIVKFLQPEAGRVVIEAGFADEPVVVGEIHCEVEGGNWRVDFGCILDGTARPNYAICGSLEAARFVARDALLSVFA